MSHFGKPSGSMLKKSLGLDWYSFINIFKPITIISHYVFGSHSCFYRLNFITDKLSFSTSRALSLLEANMSWSQALQNHKPNPRRV